MICTDDKGLKEDTKTKKITHVSKLTRQTVEKMVGEAFEYCDTNKDGLLSQKQFTEWVKQNPGALQLLETVFAKHIWSGWGADEYSGLTGAYDSDHSDADEKSPALKPVPSVTSLHGSHIASRSQLLGPNPLSPGTLISRYICFL